MLPLRLSLRTLSRLSLTAFVTGAAYGAWAQEEPGTSPFADPDMKSAAQASCGEVRRLTQGRDAGFERVDLSVVGPLALVHSDGTLAYLGLCGTAPDPKVVCVTYEINDMKVGDVVTVSGGYSRPSEDYILLDPCLATRPDEPPQ